MIPDEKLIIDRIDCFEALKKQPRAPGPQDDIEELRKKLQQEIVNAVANIKQGVEPGAGVAAARTKLEDALELLDDRNLFARRDKLEAFLFSAPSLSAGVAKHYPALSAELDRLVAEIAKVAKSGGSSSEANTESSRIDQRVEVARLCTSDSSTIRNLTKLARAKVLFDKARAVVLIAPID